MKLDRRQFLTATGALAAGSAIAQTQNLAASQLPFFIHTQNTPLMAPVKGKKRVVVCGGGWGGSAQPAILKRTTRTLMS